MPKLFAAGKIPSRNSQRNNMHETYTFVLPSYYASYLINGDASSLNDEELEIIREFLLNNNLGSCLDCSEDEWFQWYNDLFPNRKLGCSVMKFSFFVYPEEE